LANRPADALQSKALLITTLPKKGDMFVAEPHGSAGVKTNDPSLIAPIAAVG
jgi:hypothetical protein